MAKILVGYYSKTGNTKKMAELIAEAAEGEVPAEGEAAKEGEASATEGEAAKPEQKK